MRFARSCFEVSSIIFCRLGRCVLLIALPITACGSLSTSITWSPSTDASVTGYNIYYGTVSHDYTNMISTGDVTTLTISNLEPGVAYYFAATAHDDHTNESTCSNEAIFEGYSASTSGILNLSVTAPALAGDQLSFSLATGTPGAASINPNSGILSWNSSLVSASSANTVAVIITDLTDPAASTQETVLITAPDYLNLATTSVPVQTGQNASLPLTAVSTTGITNLAFTLNWPGNLLLLPTLTFNAPVAGGVLLNQGTNLYVQVWTANGDLLVGTNQFAQINFQVPTGQTSAFIELPISGVSGEKADGSSVANASAGASEVVVIGANPLLRPQCPAGHGRALILYANPGVNYELQYSADFSSPSSWQTLQDYQPTALAQSVNLDSANPAVFYRLKQD